MPMGECDRIRNYISAYIEKTLDPTTSHKIEKHLSSCPDCIGIVKKIRTMQKMLLNLNQYQCSDNFSLNLRNRINSAPKPSLLNGNIKKYSYAFSLVLVAFFVVVGMNRFFNQTDSQVDDPIGTELQITDPKPSQPMINNQNNTIVDKKDIDIQTVDGLKDSTELTQPNDLFKYVDQDEPKK
jgi:hypothetical protein